MAHTVCPQLLVPTLRTMFEGVEEADSIALDPHKWLYSPLEAGCTLVKDPNHLTETYSSRPEYYNFSRNEGEGWHNYYEYGLQNSRGFRALKVWMTLQQVGKSGYSKMIEEDVELSKLMFDLARNHPELESVTQNLSIATFRYIPAGFNSHEEDGEKYLNALNEALLNDLQQSGELFLSNAIVKGKYCLRACIVNFRTSVADIEEVINIVVRDGRKMHESLRMKK